MRLTRRKINSTVPQEKWSGEVLRLAWGGKGIASHQDGRLLILTSPLALFPGEIVEAQVTWKKKHGEGLVTRWLSPSTKRVPSQCEFGELCGGCDLWESDSYGSELKKLMIQDLFQRQLNCQDFKWMPAPVQTKRHRIQLHWDGMKLGFFERKSHRIIEIRECPTAHPSLSQAINYLRDSLVNQRVPSHPQRWELGTGTPSIGVIATTESGIHFSLNDGQFIQGDYVLREQLGDLILNHRPGSFFQACPEWAFESFSSILQDWPLSGDRLFDLYGGVGLFSAILRRHFKYFYLIESSAESVEYAKKNFDRLQINGICIQGDVAKVDLASLCSSRDTVLIDPPRVGCSVNLLEQVNSCRVKTVVMIGCDGATWARDIKRLSNYQIESLAAIDLFPNTHHAECLALLRRI
jgi:23S rRNA (uracil1939-C5)-methyltransferase